MSVLQIALKLIIFIVVGYTARKLKVLADGFDKMLTRFLLAIPLPCMIINSFNVEFSVRDLLNCPLILALSMGSLLFVFLLGHLITRKMEPNLGKAIRFSLTFTNFTFLGLSVVSEIYGDKGTFNYAIFTLPIRVFLYGGAPILLGQKGKKPSAKETIKQFVCAPVVAVFIGFFLYVTQLSLPVIIDSAIGTLGNMASPLGLILCGVIIADAKWNGILKYPCVFWVTALRLLVFPALVVGMFLLLRVDREIIKTTMFYHAMPVASLIPTFLLRYNPQAVEARTVVGYMVVITTLLCIVTIPFWSILLEHL